MGYTHYWTQKRNFTQVQWTQVCADLGAILKDVQHVQGIPLAREYDELETQPEISGDVIRFNGLGDDGHDTFIVYRKIRKPDYEGRRRGWDFCKTAQKPYDLAVTACLSYLATITREDDPTTGEPIIGTEAFSVSSDGHGKEWIEGVEEARRAVPRCANQLDIPMDIMRGDRWCAPWINDSAKGFEVHFCVDGRGYVLRPKTGESYCFESHVALAQFLERTKVATFARGAVLRYGLYGRTEDNIWNASGSFDPARHARIGKAQAAVLAKLFPVDPSCAQQPPAYVRPGEMPENAGRPFAYSVAELMAQLETS